MSPFITEWFGPQREKAKTADLPDPRGATFESGALLLTPLVGDNSKQAGLSAAHQLTHASFLSFRPWIEEGLAHFAQALYLEREKGRPAALEYMGLHRASLGEVERPTTLPRSDDEVTRSLVNTTSEELYRSKAMYVWWMLRDMVGEAALKKAIAAYRPEDDKEPSYMPAPDHGANAARCGMVLRRLGLPRSRAAGLQSGISLFAPDHDWLVDRDDYRR